MKKFITILFLLSVGYAQTDTIRKPLISASMSAGNVFSGSVECKGFEAQLIKHPTLYIDKPFAIVNLNFHYKYVFAGWGTEGPSYGLRFQHDQYQLTAGMAGKYGYATFGVNSFEVRTSTKYLALIGLQLTAGALDRIREEILYHPNNLFLKHPYLNRRWWDSRTSWQNKESMPWYLVSWSDANHNMRMWIQACDLFSIAISAGEKLTWKSVARKILIAYVANKVGFTILDIHFNN